MKNLIFLYALSLSVLGFSQENNFTILGKTNMNTFKCIAKNFTAPAQFVSQNSNKIVLNVKDFDCKHDFITKDFRKTLNADKFPQININFGKLKKSNNGTYVSAAEVTLMNKTKIYHVEISENGKILSGKQQVKFSDFGIIPPKKIGGMIVTKDEMDLSFSFQSN